MLDKRIGTPDQEPQLCAVSGKEIRGRYTIRYHLEGGFFIRVLPQHQPQFTEQLRDDLKLLIVSEPKDKRGSKKS